MEDYISQLNPQQQEAVLYTNGPSLVIAGAGSGKTRVLTYKIVHLLSHGYEPWRILALTFTNKAAREMRERIEKLVGTQIASKLWMGTFHTIFLRILRIYAEKIGYNRDFTIYDAADSKSLIKTIIKEMGLDDKTYIPSVVANIISTAKNSLISPEKYATTSDIIEADNRARRPLMHAIYKAYRNRCFVAGAMDFDDLLYFTNVLLRDNPDILHHYQEYFRYILVDEYQDTNFAQHIFVTQICKKHNNLFMVGDDAQSIYSFRGANIKNILKFRTDPNVKIFKLEQNYRSTQNIINAANSLIEKNTEQIHKQVFSCNDVGSRIEVVQSYSDYEESFLVANRISQLRMTKHDSLEEFAILYRSNAQSRKLEETLRKRNIPYRVFGGLSFFQHKEIKDVISYFRLSINPDDDEALKRIINYPARGIGETTLNKLTRCALDNRISIWTILNNLPQYDVGINSGTTKKLTAFRDMIASFIEMNNQGLDAEIVATNIIQKIGLVVPLISERTPENISKHENLMELINGVKEFVASNREEGNEENISLSDFLAEVSLATDQDTQGSAEERVTLMTAHAAKGLEFSNVFIVGVEEKLFPSYRCTSLNEIEEERRLLYVAITRAKKFCLMSYVSSRFRNGQTESCSPSRFIRDINPKYLQLSQGSNIDNRPTINPMGNYRSSFNSQPVYTNKHATTSKSYIGNNSSRATNYNEHRNSSPTSINGTHSVSELSTGMIIEHSRFGTGTIINIDKTSADARIVVKFNNVGEKTLLLKFAKFNIIG